MTLQNFLLNRESNVRLSNIALLILHQEFVIYIISLIIKHRVAYSARDFTKPSFFDITKFRNAGLPMVRKNRSDLFSRIRVILEQGSGHLFVTSSSSHLFNNTNLEQYLSKIALITTAQGLVHRTSRPHQNASF